jgi:hypothetical protein
MAYMGLGPIDNDFKRRMSFQHIIYSTGMSTHSLLF